MSAEHDDLTALLGPSALGLLTSIEQRQLDQHLHDCPRCRQELAELTHVVARLGELDGEHALLSVVEPDPQRAAAVLSALGRESAQQRRRARRWQTTLAAAASVAVLAAGLVSASALSRDDLPLEAVAVQSPVGVQASADLVPHTWGVEIQLAATGLSAGQVFTVQVRTVAGDLIGAGAFLGTGSRTMHCNLNASVLRADAAAFVVLDATGKQVLTAQL